MVINKLIKPPRAINLTIQRQSIVFRPIRGNGGTTMIPNNNPERNPPTSE